MRKRYLTGVVFLLIFLTACVSLGPVLYDDYREKSLLCEKNSLQYDFSINTELSSIQLIDKIIKGNYVQVVAFDEVLLGDDECPSDESIRKVARHVLNQVFHDDQKIQEYLDEMTAKKIVDYYNESLFLSEESNPMFLDMISVVFDNGKERIYLAYEGNTSTLLEFSITGAGDVNYDDFKALSDGLKIYYEDTLFLKSDEYKILYEENSYFLYSGLYVKESESERIQENVSGEAEIYN